MNRHRRHAGLARRKRHVPVFVLLAAPVPTVGKTSADDLGDANECGH